MLKPTAPALGVPEKSDFCTHLFNEHGKGSGGAGGGSWPTMEFDHKKATAKKCKNFLFIKKDLVEDLF